MITIARLVTPRFSADYILDGRFGWRSSDRTAQVVLNGSYRWPGAGGRNAVAAAWYWVRRVALALGGTAHLTDEARALMPGYRDTDVPLTPARRITSSGHYFD